MPYTLLEALQISGRQGMEVPTAQYIRLDWKTVYVIVFDWRIVALRQFNEVGGQRVTYRHVSNLPYRGSI